MAREEKGGVEGLKRRLYNRKEAPKINEERTPLSESDIHAPKSWNEIEPPRGPEMETVMPDPVQRMRPPLAQFQEKNTRMSFATKFFIGSIAFFILATGVSAFLFLGGINTTSPQNITVEIIAPSLIDSGKEAQLQIIVTNRNTASLELADLVIDYPEGARSVADATEALNHERISIGTIKSGEQVKRTASALFYGQEGTEEKVVARLEYSVAGSNSVFEKTAEVVFIIGSAPVALTVSAPTKVVAGDEFSMDVTVRSNATTPVENVVVEGQYPFGYGVSRSQPTAVANGKYWRLGTLTPGESQTIHIVGTVEAADGDERIFRFLVGSNADSTDTHVKVPFLTVPQTLSVEKPFISGAISVNGKSGQQITVGAGSTLQGTVEWQNNLSDSISDLELTLAFSGPAVDKSSINAQNGFYQSGNTSIIWTKDRDATLASVAPGAMGSFQFSFATLPPAAQGTLITNPTVTLNLNVRAVRKGEGGEPSVIASAASAKLILASQLVVSAQSSRNGPFGNTGPVPPRVEQLSSYTITWSVKNSANTVANTVVQTVLPPYVSFVTAQQGSGITFDAGSRTVRWTLGDLKAGVGYTSSARQAAFQVMITPSASQVGTAPSLTGTTLMSGQDRYAQVTVDASAEGPTTRTIDAGSGMDAVVPK